MPKIQGAVVRRPRKPRALVINAAAKMSDEMLDCHVEQHWWRAFTAQPDDAGWYVVRQCRRCKARRNLLLDAEGYLLASSYTYPDGYRIEGSGHLTAIDNATLRLEWVRRTSTEPTLRMVR